MKLGEDFSGGLFRRGYWPDNATGLWYSLAVAVVLMVLHQALQAVFVVAGLMFFKLAPGVTPALTKVALVSIFPASLIVFALGYWLAGLRGGVRREVLALHWPRLTPLGVAVLIIGFMLAMYAAIMLIVLVFQVDISQYTPGPHGE